MSRKTKRIIGNISVLTVLVALVAVLVFAATSPNLLKNDAKLTAEANEGTPIVRATGEPKTPVTDTEVANTQRNRTVEADPQQTWAEEKMSQWFSNEGTDSVRGFIEPFNFIQSWESKETGQITLIVDDAVSIGDEVYHKNLGPANNLYLIAAAMMESIGDDSPDLKSVVAVTADGNREESYTRQDEAHARSVESGEYVYP